MLFTLARHGDHGFPQRRVRSQHRLDLSQLNPEPAQLDLAVHPAPILNLAIGTESAQVSGAVQASRFRNQATGNEALRGQLRTV